MVLSARWVPSAEADMELLAWAMPFLSPKALDPAPATVGPGHNGAPASPPGRPAAIDNRAREFSRAMAIRARLHDPAMRHHTGLLCRTAWCEHCASAAPWRGTVPAGVQPATLADVLWFAHGMHGQALTSQAVFAHVGWQFATDAQRARWRAIKSAGVRAQKMSGFGGRVVGVASAVYGDHATALVQYALLNNLLAV